MDIAAYFNQHCVPLYIQFAKRNAELVNIVMSAFVLSIDDEWFLVTAGHWWRDIGDLQNSGYCIEKSRLIDYAGSQSKHFQPIPFDIESSVKMVIDKNKYDYGIIHLRQTYRSLLESNGIKPFDESVWDKQPENPDFHFLLGIPTELTEECGNNVVIKPTFHTVKESQEAYEAFEKNDAPTFYGKIEIDNYDLSSIKGMSGGPLVSFKKTENGGLKYWLCGVQSRWLPGKRYIAACLIKPFALAIKESLRGPV